MSTRRCADRLFERSSGLASPDVTVADPAVGTGTFLLGVLRRIAGIVENDQGAGRRARRDRGGGQTGDRIRASVRPLRRGAAPHHRRDAGADEDASRAAARDAPTCACSSPTRSATLSSRRRCFYRSGPIAKSRRDANAIKKSEPITVVIGNPPYKEKADGRGGWIEAGSEGRPAALDLWMPPAGWGVGAHAKHLKNLYVYFWRWATWKVFGSGHAAITGEPDSDREGIVCFITVAGFLNGPGFREDARRPAPRPAPISGSSTARPKGISRTCRRASSRVCSSRSASCWRRARSEKTGPEPARVRFTSLPEGRREEKFAALVAHDARRCRVGRRTVRHGASRSCRSTPTLGRRSPASRAVSLVELRCHDASNLGHRA